VEAVRALSEISRAVARYATAFLIWLFSLLVLIPIAHEVPVGVPLHALIALMAFIAVALQTYDATKAMARVLNLMEWASKFQKFIVAELVLAVDAVLLIPLLWAASPVLGGISLMLALTCFAVVVLLNMDAIIEYALTSILRKKT